MAGSRVDTPRTPYVYDSGGKDIECGGGGGGGGAGAWPAGTRGETGCLAPAVRPSDHSIPKTAPLGPSIKCLQHRIFIRPR